MVLQIRGMYARIIMFCMSAFVRRRAFFAFALSATRSLVHWQDLLLKARGERLPRKSGVSSAQGPAILEGKVSSLGSRRTNGRSRDAEHERS